MRFECEACGHLGEAAAIKPTAAGVALVCAGCGHEAILGAPGASPTASAPAPTQAPASPEGAPAALSDAPEAAAAPGEANAPARSTSGEDSDDGEVAATSEPTAGLPEAPPDARAVLQAAREPAPSAAPSASEPDPVATLRKRGIKVEVGQGEHRCPKCGFRQATLQACSRCGLDLPRVGTSTEPFERPPEGMEEQARTLDERWQALVDDGMNDLAARESFINLASTLGMLDRAARRFRFYAQDHDGTPRGQRAAESLGRLVERMHAEFVTSQGGANVGSRYTEGARRARTILYTLAVLMCVGILILALAIFGPF